MPRGFRMPNRDCKQDELCPCPFCGYVPEHSQKAHKVSCSTSTCPMFGVGWIRETEWNSRPIEDALRAQIEKTEARCKSALALYEEYHDANADLRKDCALYKTLSDAAEAELDNIRAELARKDELIEALEGEREGGVSKPGINRLQDEEREAAS